MRQVISSATDGFYGARCLVPAGGSDRELELTRLRGSPRPPRGARRRGSCPSNGLEDRLRGRRAEIGTVGEERLVPRDLLRPVTGERFEKVLAHPRSEMDDARPDSPSACLARRVDDRLELLRIVGEAREDRGQPDADVDAGCCKPANRLESARRWRGSGLRRPPDPLVERGEREVDLRAGSAGRLLENVDVAHHEWE